MTRLFATAKPLACTAAIAGLLSGCAVTPRHPTPPPAPPALVSAASLMPSVGGSGNMSPERPAPTTCRVEQLQLARAGNDAGMGHRAFAFRYTNASAMPCTLGGYPQVEALDSSGATIPDIPVTQAAGAYLVAATQTGVQMLAPGDSLWFVVTWSVIPHGDTPCPGMVSLRIEPPADTLSPPNGAGGGEDAQGPVPPSPDWTATGAADAGSSTGQAPTAGAGTVLPQVSTVCDGLRVLPLRAGPPQS